MSVINKMLRDLDSRRAQAVLSERRATPELLRGTASVAGLTAQQGRRRGQLLGLAVLALVVLAVAAWLAWPRPAAQPAAPQPAAVPWSAAPAPAASAAAPASPVSAQPASAPAAAEAALPPVQQIMEAAAQAAAQRSTDSSEERKQRRLAAQEDATAAEALPRPRRAASTAQQAAPTPPAGPQASAAAPAAAMAEAPPLPPQATPAPPAAPAAAAASPRRASAVQEGLAQAQALWAGGSREAAVELLRDALASAERAGAGDAEIQALARELARMELAQGRAGLALELLTRLESRLASQADLWALRGNAAQRLGRHGDAVLAYERALQLRAGEQRWLLAAAVSLAALGQLEPAARYVAQARAAGPVNPEVLNYLRQAGVAVP